MIFYFWHVQKSFTNLYQIAILLYNSLNTITAFPAVALRLKLLLYYSITDKKGSHAETTHLVVFGGGQEQRKVALDVIHAA